MFDTTPTVSTRMQAIRSSGTKPEMAVRRRLHAVGLRYRVDVRPLPDLNRRADIVFTRAKVAVFVDGCFWHGCSDHGRRTFNANGWYWPDKIARNIARDRETDQLLEAAGWAVVRTWEHEDPDSAVERVVAALRRRQSEPKDAPPKDGPPRDGAPKGCAPKQKSGSGCHPREVPAGL